MSADAQLHFGARDRTAAAWAALTTFAVVLALSYASIAMTRGTNTLAAIWPVNAVVLIFLLRANGRAAFPAGRFAAAASALVAANLLNGTGLLCSLWFAFANVIEIALALTLIRQPELVLGAARAGLPITHRVVVASVVAPALSAGIAAIGLTLLESADVRTSLSGWFFPDALGMLIILPIGILVAREDLRRLATPLRIGGALGYAALVAALTLFVFAQSRTPLLFLLTPVVLKAAYDRRALGAAGAIAAIALIAAPITAYGYGPLMIIKGATSREHMVMLQFFLLSQSLMALWFAGALDERDGLRRVLEGREREAKQDLRAKANLLMNVSHEIRTPLNAIQGLGELLAASEPLSSRQRELLHNILGASEHLRALASDLLDRSRIESGALVLAPERLDLSLMARTLVEEATLGASVRCTMEEGLACWADPRRTHQILQNLLSNAVKYAGAFGPITISGARVEGAVRVEVIDRGPGIAPAFHQQVFEPFARRSVGGEGAQSVGVGLSLVKLLAEAQGGRAGMTSTPFVETRFWVELPIEAPPGVRPSQAEISRPSQIDPDAFFAAPTVGPARS